MFYFLGAKVGKNGETTKDFPHFNTILTLGLGYY